MPDCPCKELFRFKQFDICQDNVAMKIGTDGVLLGAWANIQQKNKILDIGTGTGVIALMMAQCNRDAQIDAIEIDPKASEQANCNFQASPWRERLKLFTVDFQHFETNNKYDAIIVNPPFFDEKVYARQKERQVARHSENLSLETLLSKSALLLLENGNFSMIYPSHKLEEILTIANKYGLFLQRLTYVKGNPEVAVKRVLIELGFEKSICKESTLVIEHQRHQYTDDYISLTKDFYLKM